MQPRRRSRGSTPTALFVGVGLFIATLLVLGLVLASGDDDSEPPLAGNATSTATREAQATATAGGSSATPQPTELGQATATSTAPPAVSTQSEPVPTDTPEPGEPTPEPEPTAPEEIATETPAGVPEEPTTPPEPISGEFGVLPPAEIPSGGLSRDLQLQYELGFGLEEIPTEASVYMMQWPARTADDVAALAEQLGIGGEVVDEGGGNFTVEGDGGSLFVTNETVQFVGNVRAQGTLEDDATLAVIAQSWLLDNGLVGPEVDGGTLVSRDDAAGRATFAFTPSEPSPLLAAYPSARVTVGPGGAVYEAFVRWPAAYAVAAYPLRPADDVFNAVQLGQGFIEADLSAVPGEGPLTGTMVISAVSVIYSTAGSGSDAQFLVPVFVFTGEAQLVEVGLSVPISIYIAAASSEAGPTG
jgi:hypothetical protein